MKLIRPGLCAAAALLAASCGSTASSQQSMLVETGCVTAAGDKLVLTDLEHTGTTDVEPGGVAVPATRPTTEAYVLTGSDAQIRDQVGKRVRVTGTATPDRVVTIEGLMPMVTARDASGATGTAGSQAQDDAKADEPLVSSKYQIHMEVSEMKVEAVQPTGEQCEVPAQAGTPR